MRAFVRSVALLAGLGASGAVHSAEESAPDVRWRIGPRVGISTATGVLGIEAQHGHVGVALGTIPVCVLESCFTIVTTSLRYYLRDEGSSLSVGFFSWSAELTGIDVAYRWRFGSGWDLAAGLGFAREDGDALTLPSLAFGYSF